MRKWIVTLNKIENEAEIESKDNTIEAEWLGIINDSLIFYIWENKEHNGSCAKHIYASGTWREAVLIEEKKNGKN